MKYFNFAVILFSFLIVSCNTSHKTTTTNNSENESQMESKKMTESGFTTGTIVHSEKEGDCPITIQVDEEEGAIYYDPINITEDFQNNGEQVWFKFTRLRMMNRCDNASPIRIEEIQLINE